MLIGRLYCELARGESEKKAAVDCQGPDCVAPRGNHLCSLDARTLPGQAGGGRGRRELGVNVAALGEQLPDFSVEKSKEVHVGISTVQVLILHQELTEQHLGFVLLPHNVELHGVWPLH